MMKVFRPFFLPIVLQLRKL